MKHPTQPKDRIIVALDTPDPKKALAIVERLKQHVGCFKIGLEAMHGMRARLLSLPEEQAIDALRAYRELHSLVGPQEFTDAKLHDIDNTVEGAAREIASLGVWMFNVHAASGVPTMEKVVAVKSDALAIAVTVLTSLTPDQSAHMFRRLPREAVLMFAKDAAIAGMDGIVCSPQELEAIKSDPETKHLLTVVPGVRPSWAPANDQKRVMTPGEAIKAGADFLVIGRPITNPPAAVGDSVAAAKLIEQEIAEALAA